MIPTLVIRLRYWIPRLPSTLLQDSIYPRAHTCFNKLDLPKYDSFQELEAHLSVVVNSMDAITGFTME
ncbi:hypothetical protein EON64_05255 [archaeon]|nr:MAG: hypothetical protein EON64_05255 [archaeon]